MELPRQPSLPRFPPRVERVGSAANPRLVLVCEHSSNALPEAWPELGGDLGISAATRLAHVAWDIGALGLARGLARRLGEALGAVLLHAPLSRLIYDLNRAPNHPGAMPEVSELYEIPGNRGLAHEARIRRVQAIYRPFHAGVADVLAEILSAGVRPCFLTIHSFTPVYFGVPRAVEFGIVHDDDPALSLAILQAAEGLGLETRLNEPYSAAQDVTHTLRLHALPYRLPNAMLEIRNDLIAEPEAQEQMAAMLAPVLMQAVEQHLAEARTCAS